jgi:Carboxypeptidase regulatory-like domain
MPSPLLSRKTHSLIVFCLSLILFCLVPARLGIAQTNSGSIVGRVRDRFDKPLAGVVVRVVNEQNGNRRAKLTNEEGYFTIEDLRAGTYRISASKEGFIAHDSGGFNVKITTKNEVKMPYITLRQAAVQGKVVDRAGNALRGAKVILAGLQTPVRGAALTNELGKYTIEDLPPGPYIITAAWNGYEGRGLTSEPLTLDSEEVTASPLRLMEVLLASSPSGLAQGTSQVNDGGRLASTVHTVDVARVSNFSGGLFEALPIGGATSMRSFDEFAPLASGVAPPPYTPGARGPGVGFGVGTAGQFSVNGMRARSNNFSVDGSDNNDPDVGVRRQGFVALVPQPIESVKDFAIATLLWDTELGRNFGSQVNAVSNYGGNLFHGTLYAFFTDSRLNARNFFDYTGGASLGEDPFTRLQTGFAFGGPIRRDRTHFFLSYERQHISASNEQHFSTPTLRERTFAGAGGLPTTNGFGAGTLASTTIFGPFFDTTPLGRNVLSLYPLPNNPGGPYGVNTYTQVLPADGRGDVASFKLSHAWGVNLLSARYNFTDDRRILPSVNRAIRSTLGSTTRSHNISLVLDSELSNDWFNQARFSFGRTALDFDERPGSPYIFGASSTESVPLYGMGSMVVTSQTGALGELLIVPYSPVGVGVETFPQRRASNTFQYADTLSRTLRTHSLRFGANIRRYRLNSVLDRLYRPQAVYTGALASLSGSRPEAITGVQLASIGVASSIQQTITSGPPNSTIGLRFTEYHLFINDNWRIRPRFTLDFGLRYEYNTVPREVNERIEKAIQLDNVPRVGASIFDTPARTAEFNAGLDAYRRVLDGRAKLYEADYNNFGPRLGFAWGLNAEGTMALRGGYGVYFDTILGAVISQSRNVFANEIPVNVDPSFLDFSVFMLNNPAFLVLNRDANNNPVTPVRLVRTGACNQFGTCNQFGGAPEDFVALVGQLFLQNSNGGLAYTLPQKRLRTPYAQQWHLTFERELSNDYYFSVAYVGTKGTKLTRLTTPNLGPNVTPIVPLVPIMLPDAGGSFPDPLGFPIIVSSQVRSGVNFVADTGGSDEFVCPPQSPLEPPNSTLPFICGGAFFSFAARPNSALGAYRIFENSAASSYHSLQVEARKRYSRGFQFTAAYTWSHAIDDVSDLFPIAGAPIVAQDSFNLRAERASANFDIRHRFASSFVWDLPYGRGSEGVAALLFSDWQIASLFQAHTGQPFTLTLPFDANLDGNLSDRPAHTNGLTFLSGHGRERIRLSAGRQFTDYLNRITDTSTGIPQYIFLNGATGRNTVRGDGFINLDIALSKKFRFTEDRVLIFRTEVFNLLNRANFGLPIGTIGAPGFGTAVETVNPARMIQFALKYGF